MLNEAARPSPVPLYLMSGRSAVPSRIRFPHKRACRSLMRYATSRAAPFSRIVTRRSPLMTWCLAGARHRTQNEIIYASWRTGAG